MSLFIFHFEDADNINDDVAAILTNWFIIITLVWRYGQRGSDFNRTSRPNDKGHTTCDGGGRNRLNIFRVLDVFLEAVNV
jgi:hypothetical protein